MTTDPYKKERPAQHAALRRWQSLKYPDVYPQHNGYSPEPVVYVARAADTGEIVASIESDEIIAGYENCLTMLSSGMGRVIWVSRIQH